MKNTLKLIWILPVVAILVSCEKKDEQCGAKATSIYTIVRSDLFSDSAFIDRDNFHDTGSTTQYVYAIATPQMCVANNPTVVIDLTLAQRNNELSNPFDINGAVSTCFLVQGQSLSFQTGDQTFYTSNPATIGLKQCFSSSAYAVVYPSLAISFKSLGSREADSLYFRQNIQQLSFEVKYNELK